MAELIDVACDICGQKYRWSEDRLGTTAPCRECGTKFEVAAYTPPPDEAESGISVWGWIRGTLVALLGLAMVGLLGSLPFLRPEPGSGTSLAATSARGNRNPSVPAISPPVTPPSAVTQAQQQVQARMQARLQELQNRTQPTFAGPPQTSQPTTPGLGPAATPPSLPNRPPPPTRPAPSAGGFGIPFDDKESTGTPDPPAGSSSPSPAGEVAGAAPVITGWSFQRGRGLPVLRVRGTGFTRATQAQYLLSIALFETPCKVLSDTELELPSVHRAGPGPLLIVVTTPAGTAVAFPKDLPTVAGAQSADSSADKVYLVQKGGVLTSRRSIVVLVEDGGQARIDSIVTAGIVKQGARLECLMVQTLLQEGGAQVSMRNTAPQNGQPLPAIRFCPLPPVSSDR